MSRTVAVGSDHAGFRLCRTIADKLRQRTDEKAVTVIDCGCFSEESVDYPEYARAVTLKLVEGKANVGILVCGSGQGVNMAANKVPHMRSALCRTVDDARGARRHNNANVLALGQSVTPEAQALEIVDAFLETSWDGDREGGERHKRRVQMLDNLNTGVPHE